MYQVERTKQGYQETTTRDSEQVGENLVLAELEVLLDFAHIHLLHLNPLTLGETIEKYSRGREKVKDQTSTETRNHNNTRIQDKTSYSRSDRYPKLCHTFSFISILVP